VLHSAQQHMTKLLTEKCPPDAFCVVSAGRLIGDMLHGTACIFMARGPRSRIVHCRKDWTGPLWVGMI
jgi:hypothetical protein